MRGKDIAIEIINTSIDYKHMTGNEKYYSNFYSVNKLMYFAYCEYLKQTGNSLISEQEKIIADVSGPFFESSLFIFKDYTYEDVKEKVKQEFQLPHSIKALIDKIVHEYGSLSKQEIGILSKKDESYLEAITTKDKIITNEMIIKYIYKESKIQKQKIKKP